MTTRDRTFDPHSLYASNEWAAWRLGMSRDTFFRKRARMEQEGFPIPDKITGQYLKADIDAWIENRRQIQNRDTLTTSATLGVNLNEV